MSKQLTRKEIVELRARAIYGMFPQFKEIIIAAKPRERQRSETVLVNFDELCFRDKERYLKTAQATIEVDEKAGVLMLVEEGDMRTMDLIEADMRVGQDDDEELEIMTYLGAVNDNPALMQCPDKTGYFQTVKDRTQRIIQRARTPVYQCAKELPNE